MKQFWEVAGDLERNGVAFVVVTLLDSRGHAPQDRGAKVIVTSEGLHWGTVGGGKVEARAIRHSLELVAAAETKPPEVVTWNLQRDVGMTCGGEVTYLFEKFSTSWRLAIFGAGHVSQALIPLLQTLPCAVTCVDPREDWISRFPKAQNFHGICHPEPASLVTSFPADTYFICVSQGHAHDLPVLEAIFREKPNAPYVGAIGSDTKGLRLRNDLLARGIPPASMEKLRCPIGLPFGTNHPAEIAVSIAAELLQTRDRERSFLRKSVAKNGL